MADVIPLVPNVPDFTSHDAALQWFRAQTTQRLKQMWDDCDRFGEHCDEIHMVMNERGEGSYVAV